MARDGFMIARSVFDHELFRQKREFSRLEAWVWLIKEAAWKPRKVDVGGRSIQLDRGQLYHSVRFMAEAWGWSKSAVDRYLTRLKTETMIETAAGTGQLVITICNYNEYQLTPDGQRDSSGTPPGTAAGQQRDSSGTNKNKDNQVINKSEEDTSLRSVAPQAASKPTAKSELLAVLDAEHAQDVIDHRNKIKKPMTPKAAKMLAGKLGSFDDPNRAADFMIEKGWQSIERDWVVNAMAEKNRTQTHSSGKPTKGDILRQMRERLHDGQETDGRDFGAAGSGLRLLPVAERR